MVGWPLPRRPLSSPETRNSWPRVASQAGAGRVGGGAGGAVAGPPLIRAGDEELLAAVGEPGEGGLEEGDLDAASLARLRAAPEGGQDRGGRVQAAHDVRYGDAYLRGLAVRLREAGDAHDPGP